MPPTWAQRREALVRDGIVSPDVFPSMVARWGDCVGPYPAALATEPSQRNVHRSLQGLRSPVDHQKAEEMAALVEVERQVIPDCIGTAPWAHRPWSAVLVAQGLERLGEPEGVIACEPRSCPKRGTHSVGVKRQWGGHRGKVDTCQVGVFMGDVSRPDHALLAFRLSRPQEWARDAQRRQAYHVPEDVSSRTRPEPGLNMLDLWGAQGPPSWVGGDDALGRHTRLRYDRRERGERYVLGVPCTTTRRDLEGPLPTYRGRGRPPPPPGHAVTAWRQALHSAGWTQLTVRDGEQGPVGLEMVKRRVQTRWERKRTGPAAWRVVPRSPLAANPTAEGKSAPDATEHDGCSRSRYDLSPTCMAEVELAAPSLAELARGLQAGAGMDARLKRGKREGGRDEYQGRPGEGWQPHLYRPHKGMPPQKLRRKLQ